MAYNGWSQLTILHDGSSIINVKSGWLNMADNDNFPFFGDTPFLNDYISHHLSSPWYNGISLPTNYAPHRAAWLYTSNQIRPKGNTLCFVYVCISCSYCFENIAMLDYVAWTKCTAQDSPQEPRPPWMEANSVTSIQIDTTVNYISRWPLAQRIAGVRAILTHSLMEHIN